MEGAHPPRIDRVDEGEVMDALAHESTVSDGRCRCQARRGGQNIVVDDGACCGPGVLWYGTVMLDLRKLDTLKQMLVDATDFFNVYGYFMGYLDITRTAKPLRGERSQG